MRRDFHGEERVPLTTHPDESLTYRDGRGPSRGIARLVLFRLAPEQFADGH